MIKLTKTAKLPQLNRHFANALKLLLLVCMFHLLGCKQTADQVTEVSASKKNSARVSGPQPLPAGRAYWSVALGNFDTAGSVWNRIQTWTFNASNGTVSGTAYTWESTVKKGKTLFTGASHRCTFDGISKPSCNVFTPTGWVYPSGQYVAWSGTYTYVGSTLTITWSTIGGSPTAATDSWSITDYPTYGVARANLISSNYTLTHGHGYGSTSHWSNFKTMTNTPLIDYAWEHGRIASAGGTSGAPGVPASTTLNPVTGWRRASMGLTGFSFPSSNSMVLHHKRPVGTGGTACTNGCSAGNPYTGIVYHLASMNTTRQVAYSNFCACLSSMDCPTCNPPAFFQDGTEFPCYSRNLHPSALMQIINDNHELVGYIGIEAQNPVEASYAGQFQFQILDFTNIPGAGF